MKLGCAQGAGLLRGREGQVAPGHRPLDAVEPRGLKLESVLMTDPDSKSVFALCTEPDSSSKAVVVLNKKPWTEAEVRGIVEANEHLVAHLTHAEERRRGRVLVVPRALVHSSGPRPTPIAGLGGGRGGALCRGALRGAAAVLRVVVVGDRRVPALHDGRGDGRDLLGLLAEPGMPRRDYRTTSSVEPQPNSDLRRDARIAVADDDDDIWKN